jgi:hypothetical protein
MKSWLSRLGSWLRNRKTGKSDEGWTGWWGPPTAEAPAQPAAQPSAVEPAPQRPIPSAPVAVRPQPSNTVRLGLDFGTSTILLAAKIGDHAPRVIPLEPPDDAMPAFFWKDAEGRDHFGAEARAYPQAVHSVKLALRDEDGSNNIPAAWGLKPSSIAFLLIREALRRGLSRLQAERFLPDTISNLRLETNVGCTPLFNLQQRLLLRDICRELGLAVILTNVVEEPTAAAFEVGTAGLFGGGRTMIIDIGGGTLDVSVLSVTPGRNSFRIFATGGVELGGDRYTDVIVRKLEDEVRSRMGPGEATNSVSDRGLLWQRAEDAKIRLTDQTTVRVALGGIAGLRDAETELTREWFNKASGELVEKSVSAVTDVYRKARFALDRGGPLDPQPGGPIVERHPDGRFMPISQLELNGDGQEHLDAVFLVGGGTRIPRLQEVFGAVFGARLLDLEVYGMDPVTPIVMGLARHQRLDSVQLQCPNWSVEAIVSDEAEPILLFEPYAAVYEFDWSGTVSMHSTATLVAGPVPRTLKLAFRQVGQKGTEWPPVSIGPDQQNLDLRIDQFGNLRIAANQREIYADHLAAPWKVPDSPERPAWLPPEWSPPEPDSRLTFDPINSGPG